MSESLSLSLLSSYSSSSEELNFDNITAFSSLSLAKSESSELSEELMSVSLANSLSISSPMFCVLPLSK